MSNMLKFLDSYALKYGKYLPEYANEMIHEGRILNRYGGQTSKGMKWMKYYDQETGKLVAWEQSLNGKSKMGIYDIIDTPVVVIKHSNKNGSVNVSAKTSLEKGSLLSILNNYIYSIFQRTPNPYKEMCTGHSLDIPYRYDVFS